ncbi:MAG: hypothetical protein UX48_C0045G0006 [Candidatus Azambacteria bacterium GW2011_GWB1_46_27]|uniref:Uncharacterized protein n=1 Tax=Candidatus Azambacteria bacterium GW2011_GWB1_46_27 TaxID=1618617 RepID=A0A0G1SKA3_9BACT|nr:MAG: hypothetical protein UX48_C0045G0006 [Candidatus Azambacteria bacterium GW2011_GWB1_46_27]
MAVEIDYYITMVSKIKSFVNTKGSSSLPAHWEGGARATSFLAAHFAKQNTNSVGAKSEGAAEGGCGGNSAAPERNKTEASPAALLVQNRTPQKSFLFLLEEKIRRAQIRKSEENFFVGWRATARGGRAASLVPFKVGSRKVYNYSTNKKDTVYSVFFVCARERSRTSTPFGATTSR